MQLREASKFWIRTRTHVISIPKSGPICPSPIATRKLVDPERALRS